MYDKAVLRAEAEHDREALAELSALATAKQLADGDGHAARLEIDFGLAAAREPSTRGHLLAFRSSLELYAGQHAAARASLDAAWEGAAPRPRTKAWFELSVYGALWALNTLQNVDTAGPLDLSLAARGAGYDWLHSGLVRWVIPWLFAVGPSTTRSPPLLAACGTSISRAPSASRPWGVDLC